MEYITTQATGAFCSNLEQGNVLQGGLNYSTYLKCLGLSACLRAGIV